MIPFAALTVPIDGSAQAGHAIDTVLRLARNASRLHFCSVVEPAALTAATVMGAPVDPAPTIEALETVAHAMVNAALERALAAGVTADGSVLFGTAARAIADYAAENGSDAILICTHARTGLTRLLGGSVAESLFAASALPIVVLHADDDLRQAGPITVAVDGSAAAGAALETAIALAEPENRSLTILHAVESGEAWNEAAPVLSAAADRVRTTKLDFELVTLRGDAATTIVEGADRYGSSLVVIGTHGRRGIARAALGSVAAAVVERAHLPVVVVRR